MSGHDHGFALLALIDEGKVARCKRWHQHAHIITKTLANVSFIVPYWSRLYKNMAVGATGKNYAPPQTTRVSSAHSVTPYLIMSFLGATCLLHWLLATTVEREVNLEVLRQGHLGPLQS
jgi:hypothetical protein